MADQEKGTLTTETKQILVCKTSDQIEAKIITIHEWNAIKNGVQKKVTKKTFFRSLCWKDLGMVFLGIGITTLISICIPGFSSFSKAQLAAWFSVSALFILFSAVLVIIDFQFTKKDNEIFNGVIDTMDLVEKNRF